MKKIVALIMCCVIAFCFSSCKADINTVEDESDTVAFETPEKAYKEMVKAAEKGDFKKAVKYYNSGAADVADADLLNWYYYSLAMAENEENGCVGYPVNLLQYNVSTDFEPAKKALDDLKSVCSNLNGAFECDGRYIYIFDGKIATSVGAHLFGSIFCNAEIAEKNDKLYFVERKSDGTHKELYTVEMTEDRILVIKAVEGNTADVYSGDYIPMQASYPELIY